MMNVLMSANDVIYRGLELAIYTLMHNNDHVNIYIFTMDMEMPHPDGMVQVFKSITPDQRKKLIKIVKYFDSKHSNICFVDTYDLYMKYLDGGANQYSSFTPFAALRLIADEALPYVDSVLYLDCDTTVNADVSDVYNEYSKKDCNYAAYVTPFACDGKGEMVSGVMIMNLWKMRQTGFLAQARQNFLSNCYKYPDQEALRDAGDPVMLPADVGYCETLEECLEIPRITHFTNKLSPKIYDFSHGHGTEYFYRRYSFLSYAKKGIELMDKF